MRQQLGTQICKTGIWLQKGTTDLIKAIEGLNWNPVYNTTIRNEFTFKEKMEKTLYTFTKNGYDDFIDFIKGLAIVLVVLEHTIPL